MANRMSLATLAILIVAASLSEKTSATTYIVGDKSGWTFPSELTTYPTWASQYDFIVGDVLVFNFGSGQHNVARVTKEAFDICNSTNPISISLIGPTSITLSTSGEQYFLCAVGQHCDIGQKFSIIVKSALISPAPPPKLPPTPPPPSQPPTPSITPPPVSSPPPKSGGTSPPPTPPPTPGLTPPPIGPPPPKSGGTSPPPLPPPPFPSEPPTLGPSGSDIPPPIDALPPKSGTHPPSPPPSSSPATLVASIFVTFMSISVAFMF